MVSAAFAFSKQEGHHLGHVDPQESVQVTNDGRDDSERDGLGDSVRGKVFATERRDLKVELDD